MSVDLFDPTLGSSSVGLEAFQVKALLQVKDNLPGEIDRITAAWDPIDKQFAEALGVPYRKTIVEKPPASSYFSGTRLGVLGLPWDAHPSIAVMCDSALPSAESAAFDFATNVFTPNLYVECVVRSDPFDASSDVAASKRGYKAQEDQRHRVYQEGLVDRRAKRTLEAIVQCFSVDPYLGALLSAPLPAPQVFQTDSFELASTEPGDHVESRVFSVIRVQYTFDSYTSMRDASQPSPAALPRDFGP